MREISFEEIPLLQQFSEDELAILERVSVKRTFSPKEKIIQEGELTHNLYIILHGNVEVVKAEKDKEQDTYVLAKLKEGELFGEISFIEDLPRSADVIASSAVSVLEIPKELLHRSAERIQVYQKLLKNIVRLSIGRLREMDQTYVQGLQATVNQLFQQRYFGYYFLFVIIMASLMPLVEYIFGLFNLSSKDDLGSLVRLCIVATPAVYFAYHFNYPLKEAGMTTKNLLYSLIEGFFIGVFLSILVFLLNLGKNSFDIVLTFKQLLTGPFKTTFLLISYPFHCFIQEFIIRGMFQFSLQQFLSDTKGYFSIFIVSFLFAAFHTNWTFSTILMIFIGNLVLGWIYLKRRNLFEMTMIHAVVGMVVLNFGQHSNIDKLSEDRAFDRPSIWLFNDSSRLHEGK